MKQKQVFEGNSMEDRRNDAKFGVNPCDGLADQPKGVKKDLFYTLWTNWRLRRNISSAV